jgi:threonine/homoserine/homoserine lactone efflux protein
MLLPSPAGMILKNYCGKRGKIIQKNDTNKNAWPYIKEGFLTDVLIIAFTTTVTAIFMLSVHPLFIKWGMDDGQYLFIVLIAGLPILWLLINLFKIFDKWLRNSFKEC